jgi:hypothetical protein
MATLKIGVRSIAVAPCSCGRYTLDRFSGLAGTACADVCMVVSQDLTHTGIRFHSRARQML